jgi:hypothetical protein
MTDKEYKEYVERVQDSNIAWQQSQAPASKADFTELAAPPHLIELNKKLDAILEKLNEKHPHKCPFCDGKGLVENDILPIRGTWSRPSWCKQCEGTGIIWR